MSISSYLAFKCFIIYEDKVDEELKKYLLLGGTMNGNIKVY